MLLDLVDNLIHSSYIAHSWSEAAGMRDCESFYVLPVSPAAGDGIFELNSGASGIVLEPFLLDS